MKLVYETIERRLDESFRVLRQVLPAFDCPYHFHAEVELTLIENSHGTRLIGDHMAHFGPGDLVLIGANVPHWYYNHAAESRGDDWARSVVVQFRPDFLGEAFLHAAEIAPVRRLLDRAQRGLVITGDMQKQVTRRLVDLLALDGCARLVGLVEILHAVAEAGHEVQELGTGAAVARFGSHDANRLDKVFRYIREHFADEVRLDQVAAVAGMTPSSFSRFFRQKVGRTFQMAVIQVRAMEACQQLMTSDASITEICYACGFNNLSNFNRRFKHLTGVTPKAFRRQWASSGRVAWGRG